jgi:hypothetical protein
MRLFEQWGLTLNIGCVVQESLALDGEDHHTYVRQTKEGGKKKINKGIKREMIEGYD